MDNMQKATVTSKGQVTIPKTIRDRLGVSIGSQVVFYEDAYGQMIMASKSNDLSEVVGIIKTKINISPEQIESDISNAMKKL